jgi:hypothetical protein
VTQLLYSDMKSKIEGELSLKPARVAAHVGATLRTTLAGSVDEAVVHQPAASRQPCGGRRAGMVWG